MSALSMSTLFPRELETELFSKVKGHSSLARMSGQDAIPFTGKDIFTFDLDSDISIVGENGPKPAGDATIAPVSVKPIKVVYQSRVSDEFMKAAEEKRLEYLRAFAEGFSKKLAAGIDKMAIHGIDPRTGNLAPNTIGNNYFDYVCADTAVVYSQSTPDANLESAITVLENNEYEPNGIILAPIMRGAIGAMTTDNGSKYPDFQFGGVGNLGGHKVDSNITVGSASGSNDRALVGDFELFRWGIAEEIPLEVIQFGNPDGGAYDLKQANQVLLRSEAWVGWGILDPKAFCLVCKDGTPVITT